MLACGAHRPGCGRPAAAATAALPALTMCMLAAVAAAASPAPTPLGYSVVDFGADAAGAHDSTAAFNSACAAAAAASPAESSVFVPAGTYLITGLVNLTVGLALRGPPTGSHVADHNSMPLLRFRVARNGAHSPPPKATPQEAESASRRDNGADRYRSAFVDTSGGQPTIVLCDSSSVSGVRIGYDWGGQAPFEVPPAIQITGGEPRVTGVKLEGPWVGVSSLGNPNAGRFYVADVFVVDAHSVGVAMGASFDFSWLVNVEVWAPTSASAFANGTGVLLNGIDGVMVSGLGVFRYSKGVHLVNTLPGLPPHKVWGTFSNVITDYCINGFVTEGQHDVTLSSSSFHSHETSVLVTGDPAGGPDTGNGGGASLRVSACDVGSNGAPAFVVASAGASAVTVTGSSLLRVFSADTACAVQVGGNATQVVTITGCDIATTSADALCVSYLAKANTVLSGNNVRANVPPQPHRMCGAAWGKRGPPAAAAAAAAATSTFRAAAPKRFGGE